MRNILYFYKEELKSDLFNASNGKNPFSSILKNDASDISIGGLSPLLKETRIANKQNEENKTKITTRGVLHNFPVKQRKN